MIYGIGVDITTVGRIEKVYSRFGQRFARRFLHTSELEQLKARKNQTSFLAKRFAAKEAAVKALGTGERQGVLLKDFYVHNDALGKPILNVSGEAAKRCELLGINNMHISISDEKEKVIAFVVLEKT